MNALFNVLQCNYFLHISSQTSSASASFPLLNSFLRPCFLGSTGSNVHIYLYSVTEDKHLFLHAQQAHLQHQGGLSQMRESAEWRLVIPPATARYGENKGVHKQMLIVLKES